MPRDADQIANLDAELDALVSPTALYVLHVADDYDPAVVAASAAKRALDGGGGGGSLPVKAYHKTVTNADLVLGEESVPLDQIGANELIVYVGLIVTEAWNDSGVGNGAVYNEGLDQQIGAGITFAVAATADATMIFAGGGAGGDAAVNSYTTSCSLPAVTITPMTPELYLGGVAQGDGDSGSCEIAILTIPLT